MVSRPQSRKVNRKRGSVLIVMLICVTGLLGMLGLVIDLGRAFIVKGEAQAFTDAAALGAAAKLDGSENGVATAQAYVNNSPDRWNMATSTFTSVTTEFSTDMTEWSTSGSAASRYVRVTAPSNSLGMTFLRVVGAASSMTIAARTIAGVQLGSTFSQGVFPFAPIAHSSVAPNFGYTTGDELTLLWPSSVGSNGPVKMNNLCRADRNPAALLAVQAGTTADRGYIQDTSASSLAAAIEDDHMDYTVALHQPVDRSGGVKSHDVNDSLANRVAQDTLPNQQNYEAYTASHDSSPLRRVVIVPIIGDAVIAEVVGFVRVFLPPDQPNNPNDAKCAMYLGPADVPTGNLGTGANTVRIVQ